MGHVCSQRMTNLLRIMSKHLCHVSEKGMRRRSAQENADDESDNESQLTSYGDTVPSLQALKLAAGFGHVGKNGRSCCLEVLRSKPHRG